MASVLLALVAVATWRLRARRGARVPTRVDPGELGLGANARPIGVVGFSTPYCLPCQRWEAALHAEGVPFAKVDVADRPDLVRRYRIRETPLVLAVRLPGGEVVQSFGGDPRDDDVHRLSELAGGALRRSA